jgi:hypothetical protein
VPYSALPPKEYLAFILYLASIVGSGSTFCVGQIEKTTSAGSSFLQAKRIVKTLEQLAILDCCSPDPLREDVA